MRVSTTDDGLPALHGDLDLFTVPALEACLRQIGDADIDLSGVSFFDSSALRTFLAFRRRNHKLRIVNPSRTVARVLEVTGTLDYLVHGREINW